MRIDKTGQDGGVAQIDDLRAWASLVHRDNPIPLDRHGPVRNRWSGHRKHIPRFSNRQGARFDVLAIMSAMRTANKLKLGGTP